MTQELFLADDLMPDVKNGHKRVTVRTGKRNINLGSLTFRATNDSEVTQKVNVYAVTYCKFFDLSLADIQDDGAMGHDELYDAMLRFYPDLKQDDVMTVVRFHVR